MFAYGTLGQRKVGIEARVGEIKTHGSRLNPIFKIPTENDKAVAEPLIDLGVGTTHHVVDPSLRNRSS